MADDKRDSKRPQDFSSDSGLGNLPPLSDFDSQSGVTPRSDSGLPPMSSFDSDITRTPSGGGGLPPLSELEIETPTPTGGNIRPAPGGFAKPKDTFSSGSSSGGGFQDLAADSDFSPETPEIGPGPDSNVDTPMFDSAFGGGSGGFSAVVDTPAPTQAMETPMFGMSGPTPGAGNNFGGFGGGGSGGFGGGGGGASFGASGGGGRGSDFNVGTPAPDFSPDTELQPAKKGKGKAAGGGGGGSPAVIAIAAGIALLVGIVAGPYAAQFLPLPNPSAGAIAKLEAEKKQLTGENANLKKLTEGGPTATKVDPKEREKLIGEIAKLKDDANAAKAEFDTVSKGLDEKKTALAKVEQDTQDKTAEYVKLQGEFETLDNETKITQARQRGLIAEVERLNGQVGKLEEANTRSIATKDSLTHAVDRLAIQVQEASPLTPEKYNHDARVAAVNDLREKVASAPWVTPALLEAYTSLYLREMEIASSQEYFFAKVPVTDKLGTHTRKWAECLMQGNWAVRYRSLDGENVGSFENVGNAANPKWGVKELEDPAAQREIAALIAAKRTPNFEEAVAMLIEKEKQAQGSSDRQRKFDSL